MLQIFRKISKENQRNSEPPWAAASVKKENRVRTKPELLSQRMKREDGSAKDTRKPQQVKSECGILGAQGGKCFRKESKISGVLAFFLKTENPKD